MFEWGGDIWIC